VLDLSDVAGDERHVIRPQADRATVAEARERLGRPPAEENHDPVAQPVEPLHGLPLQADAERSSTTTATVPHADPEDGEGGAELLRPQVGEKSRHTSGDLARRRLHDRVRHLQPLQHFDVDASERPVLIARCAVLPGPVRTVTKLESCAG